MKFSKWLQQSLIIKGMNQATLAKKMQVHRSVVCNWIGGRHLPEPRRLLVLADILQLENQETIDMLQSIINSLQESEC